MSLTASLGSRYLRRLLLRPLRYCPSVLEFTRGVLACGTDVCLSIRPSPSVVEAGGSSLWPDSGLRLRCVPSWILVFIRLVTLVGLADISTRQHICFGVAFSIMLVCGPVLSEWWAYEGIRSQLEGDGPYLGSHHPYRAHTRSVSLGSSVGIYANYANGVWVDNALHGANL